MSVTIGEIQVEVEQPAAPAGTPQAPPSPSKSVDLRYQLEILRERELRLQAD
jgi:hypothetical protein